LLVKSIVVVVEVALLVVVVKFRCC